VQNDKIFPEISDERLRQDAKWGEQNHDPFTWLCILGEEVGEVNKAACDAYKWPLGGFDKKALKNYRAELVQVAAVAISMLACLDRGKWCENEI
jgi:hypothetical protein